MGEKRDEEEEEWKLNRRTCSLLEKLKEDWMTG